jgi:hypothetical protein
MFACVGFSVQSDDKLATLYRPIRMKLSAKVSTGIPDVLAAREGEKFEIK